MNFELWMNMMKTKWENVIFFEGTIVSCCVFSFPVINTSEMSLGM